MYKRQALDGTGTITPDPEATGWAYKIIFIHDNALEDIGNPIPGVDKVELRFDVISITNPGGSPSGIVKMEYFAATASFPNGDTGGGSLDSDVWDPISLDTPGSYVFVSAEPIPDRTAAITPVLGTTGVGTILEIDNVWLGKAGTYSMTKASNPNPANGATVGSSLEMLSWTNPEPFNPAEATTCDVYFLDAGELPLPEDPNLGPDLVDSGAIQIADDLPAEILDLNDALETVLPLNDDHYYYWAVHCTDPNNGVFITSQGDIWYFYTGDAVPVVDAGPDQFMWLSQDDSELDGGNDPNVRWFKVIGTYTDDGKSEIADANSVNLNWEWDPDNGEFGIIEVSDVHDEDTQTVTAVYKTVYAEGGDPDMSTAIPGYWNLELQVTDGIGTGRDASYHRIDEDCLSAAENDPSDDYDGAGDFNRDCKKNLADFAVFAAGWLECNALKLDDCP